MYVCSGLIAAAVFMVGFPVRAQEEVNTRPANAAELQVVLNNADRVVIYQYDPEKSESAQAILYTSRKSEDLDALKQALAIETPQEWYRCSCLPTLEIRLFRKGKEIGAVSLFEGSTIELAGWTQDVRLADAEKLRRWFQERGIGDSPSTSQEQANRDKDAAAARRWIGAMPEDLRPLWPGVLRDPIWQQTPAEGAKVSARNLEPALAKEYPDASRRIRLLFAWFGSGAGPWSGYYGWEDVPAQMLLRYPGEQLASALQGAPLTDAEAEGAARLFVNYAPGEEFRRPDDRTLLEKLPDTLREELLAHVAETGDAEKLQLAKLAFE
jgi:hypothetical protein